MASGRRSRRRSLSEERGQTDIVPSATPVDSGKTKRRPQSTMRGDVTAPTPIQLRPDIQQRVSVFVQENFHIKSASTKKTVKSNKTNFSSSQRSEQTEFSMQSGLSSIPNTIDENEGKSTPKVAFA